MDDHDRQVAVRPDGADYLDTLAVGTIVCMCSRPERGGVTVASPPSRTRRHLSGPWTRLAPKHRFLFGLALAGRGYEAGRFVDPPINQPWQAQCPPFVRAYSGESRDDTGRCGRFRQELRPVLRIARVAWRARFYQYGIPFRFTLGHRIPDVVSHKTDHTQSPAEFATARPVLDGGEF